MSLHSAQRSKKIRHCCRCRRQLQGGRRLGLGVETFEAAPWCDNCYADHYAHELILTVQHFVRQRFIKDSECACVCYLGLRDTIVQMHPFPSPANRNTFTNLISRLHLEFITKNWCKLVPMPWHHHVFYQAKR